MKPIRKTEWQEAFMSNVTRCTFKITLTNCMMEFLCAVSDNVRWDRDKYGGLLKPNNWLVTERALTDRGLIRRRFRITGEDDERADRSPLPYELTPVGVALVEMFKVGGIFIEAEEARTKLGRRRGRN